MRPRFTREDDLFLTAWLAKHNANGVGRRGIKIYEKLVQEHPTGTELKPSAWQKRYVQRSAHFDALIRQYVIDHLGSEAPGSSVYIPPEVLPVTAEDEALLVEYVARYAGSGDMKPSGRKLFQKMGDNAGGCSPWGAKHTWHRWRDYYRSHSEKLDKLIEEYRLTNNIVPQAPPPVNPSELDHQFSGFIAEMVAKGATTGSRVIYRTLVQNEEGKWPWSKQYTAESWRTLYYQKRELLEPLIKEKLDKIPSNSDTGIKMSSSSKPPKVAGRKRKLARSMSNDDNDVDRPEDPGGHPSRSRIDSSEPLASGSGSPMTKEETMTPVPAPMPPLSPLTSLVSARTSTSESGEVSWPQESSSGLSFSRYSEPRPETSDPVAEAATMAVLQLPSYGMFTRQDDTVLLKYMLERSLDEKLGKKRRVGDLFEGIDVFQELTKTVPAAGRHTAQTWRTRYLKNKMQFDRVVNQLKGPVEKARRQALNVGVADSSRSFDEQMQMGDDDKTEQGGRTRIRNPHKRKVNVNVVVREQQLDEQGQGLSARVDLEDGRPEIDMEEEGEVAEYLCDLCEF